MLLSELVLPLRVEDNKFKGALLAAGVAVGALVAGMGLAIKATFKWADELDQIQDIMGVTNKTAAALNFTLRKSGTDTERLTKGMTILAKGLVKADGTLDTVGKGLKAWGVNVKDANGMLKDQTTLISDISDKYSTFATQQEKVNFLTEVFGRSGAELIDFFDTLAAEGGLDAVTAKMERFGLAIDPNRYEQFNRNLEELKLIGLGMAVAFTEKVMPVIEKFLEFISDPKGIDLSKIAAWADTTIAIFIKGLGDSVNDWVASGGPEAFSEALISWIDGIGDEERIRSKTEIAMSHLAIALGEAIANIDWAGIGEAIHIKMVEILQPVQSALNAWLITTMQQFAAWSTVAIPAALSGFGAAISTMIGAALNALKILIINTLTSIAKEFYNRAQGWVNQAIQGFNANKGRLLSEIGNIVTSINAILKKIITSFVLTLSVNDLTGGASADSNLGGSEGSSTAGGGRRPRRKKASGGPVFGGQAYTVGELGPELFVPSGNGSIVPNNQMGGEPTVRLRREDINEFASVLARILPAELQKVRA